MLAQLPARFSLKPVLAMLAALLVAACMQTNEITGRDQFMMIPASEDSRLGLEAMQQVKDNAPVLTTGPMAERVKRIGQRIARVSDKPDMTWEFVVIDEPQLNAWALPGGKVAVYAKMMQEIDDDQQLAAVLGHEIAHAVLRHGAEQMSRAQAQNVAIAGLGVAVGASTDSQTAGMAVALGSLAAKGLVQLPHSRFMELEADHIGTRYMARAGYDPRASVALWQRMNSLKEGGGGQPVWLSTHPADDKRIRELQARMPVYMQEYRATVGQPAPN
ncbi:M48 family metallopeptidase [Yunchengibacter salinarum]|uniref:M48 family metallopeptidase n=1 Tax=Yunchengibacter salinarum TaxID=3133399 RepID=UPI0035B57569